MNTHKVPFILSLSVVISILKWAMPGSAASRPIECFRCKALATNVCSSSVHGPEGWLCDKCAKEHECGEDMFLPIVNSPRTGMCGYCG